LSLAVVPAVIWAFLAARGVSRPRAMRCLTSFPNEFRKCREDDLELRTEWTNCAGDISTIDRVGSCQRKCREDDLELRTEWTNCAGDISTIDCVGSCQRNILYILLFA